MSSTAIYAAKVRRPDGERVHVMGYQNSVGDSHPGPNAMILPIPSAELLGPDNFVDTTTCRRIVRDYRQSVADMKPRIDRTLSLTKGGEMLRSASAKRHVVFLSGSYTVASASSAMDLGRAIRDVPEGIRPDIPTKFLVALGRMYPGWAFVACCFAGETAVERDLDPVVLWHRPMPGREDKLFAPAVDAHDGNPPDLSALVMRDHTLAFGDSDAEGFREGPGLMSAILRVPEEHRWMFTRAIVGSVVGDRRRTKNGDFVMPTSRVTEKGKPGYLGADEMQVEVPGA